MILIVRCYPFPIFLLKRKVPEKIHELSIQRQDTVGDILIDNLKPDVFKNGFLKAFCNTIKLLSIRLVFLAREILQCAKLRKILKNNRKRVIKLTKTFIQSVFA